MLKKVIAAILSSSIAFSLPINTIGSTKYRAIRANAADAESNTEKAVKLGDPNNDGIIDAVDASLILANYTKFSTTSDIPDEYDLATSDINNDNLIDAVDASTVLSYYAYSSVGGKLDFAEYLKAPNGEPSETTATTTASATTTTTTTASNTTTTVSQTTVTSVVSSTVSTAESTTSATTTTIPEDLDTDSDGLTDVYENSIGTDVNKADTDGDGLTDYQEFNITDTDPLVRDSVTKDVSDADADIDNDGLSNAEEIKLETDANDSDTDSDGLKDGEEVKTYKTDPLKYDTDDDTISDGDEVKLKTDPTKASSDGTTSDKDRKFVQKLDKDSDVFSTINTDDNPFKVSMEIKASGYAETAMDAGESGYSSVISSDMVLGIIPEFKYEEGFTVEDVVLNFDIDSKYTENTNGKYAAVSEDFKGIKRFNVFKYFDDINMLLPIETTYDEENKRVSTHVDELGTYCLIDMEKWNENLGITPDEYQSESTQPDVKNLPRVPRMFAPDTISASDPIDVIFHVYARVGTPLGKVKGAIRNTAEQLFEEYGENGHVRIAIAAHNGSMAIVSDYTENDYYAYNLEELNTLLSNTPGVPESFELKNLNKSINTIMKTYNESAKEKADRYYVFIENSVIDATAKEKSNIIETFINNNFAAVVLSNFPDDYYDLAVSTGGTFIKKISDFGEPTANFIIENHSKIARYTAVVPTGWKKVKLDKPITPEYKGLLDGTVSNGQYDFTDRSKFADTDGDGLIDISEVLYRINDEYIVDFNSSGEVILPTLKDCMEFESYHDYVKNALAQYKFNWKDFKKVKILPIKSDPSSADSDFDGITDDKDNDKLNIVNKVKLVTEYSEKFYHGDIEYSLDLRDFFKSSKEFNEKLANWGAILSTVVYTSNDKRYVTYSNEDMHADKLLELHGFEGVQVYDTRKDKDDEAQEYLNRTSPDGLKNDDEDFYPDNHALKMFIGYKNLEYNGQKKTIIAVALEGTETSLKEWTSNFDLGSTTEREAALNWIAAESTNEKDDVFNGEFDLPLKYWAEHNPEELEAFEDWKTAEHHKGFDIVANRCKKFIDKYIEFYKDKFYSSNPSFFVTGHSRAAATGNLLSYYLINDKHETFGYNVACPSTTTDTTCKDETVDFTPDYSSIFNINNTDDFVPMIPMDTWHFKRYGVTAEKSVRYHPSFVGEWGAMMKSGKDDSGVNLPTLYNSVFHWRLDRTVKDLSFLAMNSIDAFNTYNKSDTDIKTYMLDKEDDYFRNNCYSYVYDPDFKLVYDPDNEEYDFDSYTSATFAPISKIKKIPDNAKPFCLINPNKKEVCEMPAFFMQVLAAHSAEALKGGIVDFLFGIDMADRYFWAKASLIDVNIPLYGGISHPHYLQSYLVLSKHIKAKDFEE